MRCDTFWRWALRRSQFERCESRLVFSSIPGLPWDDGGVPDLTTTTPQWVELAPAAQVLASGDLSHCDSQYVRNTYGFYGAGQTVAIIDSGIAWDHEALGGGLGAGYRVVGGWDFTEEQDADPYDDGPAGFHGTHVAGIIAAQDPEQGGVAAGVDLVGLRVFNDQGYGYTAWVEQALRWVHTHKDDYRYPITTVNLSLGSRWNGSAPPSWGTLEEELAQLATDGIFVAVAAGNSFTTYGAPGLAYPAASPYVVPVASAGADGQLSDFSQRHHRALVAPGESITSTVPDHVYGADGRLDDWAAASGTSMAAPYLAGASVLVREAMQYAGYAVVTQADVYTQLRATADRIYDPTTGAYYHHLNLARAIDTLMPADDYSSDVLTPHQLGVVHNALSLSGQLARLDDRDVFQFTVGISGQLVLDATGHHRLALHRLDAQGQFDELPVGGAVPVDAGSTFVLIVSADSRLTDYSLELSVVAPRHVDVQGNVVRVTGTEGNDLISLSFRDGVQLEVNGVAYEFARAVNWQFEMDGTGGWDTLVLTGSPQDDSVTLRAGAMQFVGAGYQATALDFSEVTVLDGGGRRDAVRLWGTTGDDLLTASPTRATMQGAGYLHVAEGFERIYGCGVSGANDVARLYDSAGDDMYYGRSGSGTLSGPGFALKAWDFDRLYAYATAGLDRAVLYDTPDNDYLNATASVTTLTGGNVQHQAWNFQQVDAYASGGGYDIAWLDATHSGQAMVTGPGTGRLQNQDTLARAIQFDQIYAIAAPSDTWAALQEHKHSASDLLFASEEDSDLTNHVADRSTGRQATTPLLDLWTRSAKLLPPAIALPAVIDHGISQTLVQPRRAGSQSASATLGADQVVDSRAAQIVVARHGQDLSRPLELPLSSANLDQDYLASLDDLFVDL